MKKLGIILAIVCLSFAGFGQTSFDDQLQYDIQTIESDQLVRPTWKEGHDNSSLRGLLQNIFSDDFARTLYAEQLSMLYINGPSNFQNKHSFDTWITSISIDSYSDCTFEYYSYDHIEQLIIKDKEKTTVRKITVVWDKSYDGTTYSNIRTISDSIYN